VKKERFLRIIRDMRNINEKYMERALHLAGKGIGTTSPNPRVGAVVVKNGDTVGEGWHKKAGEPHAEVIALKKAGKYAKQATLYVTLEPCSTTGHTPPCTDEIIRAGISRVIIGTTDPNPKHSGRGIKILANKGITVKTGVLEAKCMRINEGFEKYITQGLPFVTLKLAMSLDGRIATRKGDSKWITGEKSRKYAHILRNQSDAIMVGIGTVKQDNPLLTIRLKKSKIIQPKKIVVDARGEISTESNLLSADSASSTIVALTSLAPTWKLDEIGLTRAETIICKDNNGRVDLIDLMRKIAKKGIVYLLVEGGGTLVAGIIDSGLADKIAFFYAPVIIGGKDAVGAVMGEGVPKISDALRIGDIKLTRIGADFLLEGYIKK
jgi:diaminohydroxyphosphoribosylaminopyrimidine deaminase / 5-amino-6-(5-phosphoribosylamino)uracil reductase